MLTLFCFIVLGLVVIKVFGIILYFDPEGAMSLIKNWEVPAFAGTDFTG